MKTAKKLAQIAKKNHKTFKVGDMVKCLKDVSFTDGSYHYKGKTYNVTSENLAYFNVCHKDYNRFLR